MKSVKFLIRSLDLAIGIGALFTALLHSQGCSNTNFSGAAGPAAANNANCGSSSTCVSTSSGTDTTTSTSTSTTTSNNPSTGTGGANSCVTGDQVKFAWSGPEKSCIVDQGLTYDFGTKKCTQMKPAKFTCTWDNVYKELARMGISLTTALQNDPKAGAKLISCGESQDGNRLVLQWIKLADASAANCNYDPGNHFITTGCYTVNGLPTMTADQVYQCINTL